jgi:hypothetical protein
MKWSQEERNALLQWADARPVSAIADMLGRTIPSVRAEACRMRKDGIDCPVLRNWWVCPVCGHRNDVSTVTCEACYRRELRDLSHKRRELAEAMREAHRAGDTEEVTRINHEIEANNQLVKNCRREAGTSPRAPKESGQTALPFTD